MFIIVQSSFSGGRKKIWKEKQPKINVNSMTPLI